MARPVVSSCRVVSPLQPCPEAVSWADAALWGCTVVARMFAGASVTHERALETREPIYVPRVAKSFFIHVVHSPLGTVGHVAAPELPSQEGRARSHGTRGSTGALLSGRRGPDPRDTW
jgi:hypothetical protein